jgi:hypothetical protein
MTTLYDPATLRGYDAAQAYLRTRYAAAPAKLASALISLEYANELAAEIMDPKLTGMTAVWTEEEIANMAEDA